MPDIHEFLAKPAERATTIVEVCLAGSLVAEHEALEARLNELKGAPDTGIEGNGQAEVAEKIRALEQRMKAETFPFRLRALKRADFKSMINACPPRRTPDGEVDERDAGRGFNIDDLYERLVPASIVEPALAATEIADLVSERLTDGQFIEIGNAAFYLNRGSVDVPFSRAASRLIGSSGGE